MFQNLRENQQIYVLTKGQTPSLDIGTVVKVQGPMAKFPQMGQGMMPQTEYVIDIVVSVNGINRSFQQLPVNKDSAEYVNEQTIIAMTRDAMNAEINALKTESVQVIQRARDEEAKLPIWDKLILQLNPEVAAKQRQDEEIASLKEQVSQMAKSNANLESMLSKVLTKLGEDENKPAKSK